MQSGTERLITEVPCLGWQLHIHTWNNWRLRQSVQETKTLQTNWKLWSCELKSSRVDVAVMSHKNGFAYNLQWRLWLLLKTFFQVALSDRIRLWMFNLFAEDLYQLSFCSRSYQVQQPKNLERWPYTENETKGTRSPNIYVHREIAQNATWIEHNIPAPTLIMYDATMTLITWHYLPDRQTLPLFSVKRWKAGRGWGRG